MLIGRKSIKNVNVVVKIIMSAHVHQQYVVHAINALIIVMDIVVVAQVELPVVAVEAIILVAHAVQHYALIVENAHQYTVQDMVVEAEVHVVLVVEMEKLRLREEMSKDQMDG